MRTALIAGAGIAGLASGLALARAGHEVTILERAATLSEVGAGIQLGPNAVRVLKQLGVWPHLKALAVAPGAVEIRDGLSGRILSCLPLTDAFEARFGAPYRVAHRADLLKSLLTACAGTGNLTIRTGQDLHELTVEGATVIARTRDDEFLGDVLIGADGIRSTVRGLITGNSTPRLTGHVLYRACPKHAGAASPQTQNSVVLWLLPRAHVVHYPVSGGKRLNIVATVTSKSQPDGWSSPAPQDEAGALFKTACPALQQVLACSQNWLKWTGAEAPALPCWNKGPVTLAGDAAHAALPFLAQGAAMALEDAAVLAAKLNQNTEVTAALSAYGTERAARTSRHTKAARRQGTIYHLAGPARFARNLTLRTLPAAKTHDRMAWLYQWAPPSNSR